MLVPIAMILVYGKVGHFSSLVKTRIYLPNKNDAVMNGNSIDEIRKVYTQIKDIQFNINESKIELEKTEASANGVAFQNHL